MLKSYESRRIPPSHRPSKSQPAFRSGRVIFSPPHPRLYAEHEVDFVVRHQESVTRLIQSCYLSSGDPLPDREISALVKAAKALSCSHLTIVTWDWKQTLQLPGFQISLVPLHHWLTPQ